MTYAPVWSPPVVRPPLLPRARRGAAVAGVVGFLMFTIGWAVVAAVAVITFILTILSFVSDASDGSAMRSLGRILDDAHLGTWVWAIVLAGVLGLILVVFSVLTSGWILKAHQVNHPWGVTWAGLGIAIVANWILGGIVSAISQVAGLWSNNSLGSAAFVGYGIFGLVSLLIVAAIGWLSWWWMAHALRPKPEFVPQPTQ